MSWNNSQDFFAMGGYGLYVWGSYGAVVAWMLIEPWMVWRRHRQAFNGIRRNSEQDN